MSIAISELSSFAAINRSRQIHWRSFPPPRLPSKLVVAASLGGPRLDASTSEPMNNLNYKAGASTPHFEGTLKTDLVTHEPISKKIGVQEDTVTHQKRFAKLHDFCLGIPYGGLLVGTGLFGFIFSRNIDALVTNVVFGGALLALSSISLKIWRLGKSTLPYILGQAVLAAALEWNYLQTYSMTKKLFPTGFYAAVSAAMLCFYLYVVISGGNPPPKKNKLVAA